VITARALGVYVYLKATEAPISAENLARVFPEAGRKSFLAVLKELREAGLIITSRAVINGRYVTYSKIVDGSPIRALLSQQTQQNSYIPNIANSYISKPNSETSSQEGTRVREYYESEEDRLEAQAKFYAKKKAEKAEAHAKRQSESMVRRSEENAFGWSVTDSTFEFAAQMHNLWHIEPWQVTRSRFRFALATKRSEYGTTGDIEIVMMKLFFDKIKHDTKLHDPEMVWKKFIIQFGVLLEDAKKSMVTQEEVVAEREEAKKSRDWLRNV
jgi:hypothetical protein